MQEKNGFNVSRALEIGCSAQHASSQQPNNAPNSMFAADIYLCIGLQRQKCRAGESAVLNTHKTHNYSV